MNLYILETIGLGDYYVVADDPSTALDFLESSLNIAGYGISGHRIVCCIRIATKEVGLGRKGSFNFSDRNRLLICN